MYFSPYTSDSILLFGMPSAVQLLLCSLLIASSFTLTKLHPTPSNLQKEAEMDSLLKQVSIERYKAKILNRLHMTEVPDRNSTNPTRDVWTSLPYYIQQKYLASVDRENNNLNAADTTAEVKETVLLLKPLTQCMRGRSSTCLGLDYLDEISNDQISSVTLHMEVTNPNVKGKSISLTEVVPSGKHFTILNSRLMSVTVGKEDGVVPVQLDITGVFKHWLRHRSVRAIPKLTRTLMVQCENCRGQVATPIDKEKVIVEILYRPLVRRRRSIGSMNNECSPHLNQFRCCTQRLNVRFEDIGWHRWVIHPLEFEPNYCKGSCEGGMMGSNHGEVIKLLRTNKDARLTEAQRKAMKTCCTPSRMGAMSLIYVDHDGSFKMITLHNLIALDCGCQ